MTNKINFSQVIKNKKIWAVAAVVIGLAAVVDSIGGSEYANHYESNYGYPQGQVNHYPNSPGGGTYPMNPGYVPMPNVGSYPVQPSMQPTFNPPEQMNTWQKNQLRQERSNQQFLDMIRN